MSSETVVDVYGNSAEQIYKGLEGSFGIPKDFSKREDEATKLQDEFYFMEDDANEILANIGLEQKMDISNYPTDQLFRIFRYYHKGSEKEEDGKMVPIDPLPDYKAGDGSYEDELYKIGYKLGRIGTVGLYYRLLPDTNFRHGYWIGKMEKAIELDDDNLILEVSREVKIYNAETADEEFGKIVNGIFVASEETKVPVRPQR